MAADPSRPTEAPISARTVPITMGSDDARSVVTDLCTITEAWFPPNAVLARHRHDQATFATMIDGAFDIVTGGRRMNCQARSSWIEPRETRHANYIGTEGAHVVVVQPHLARADDLVAFDDLFAAPRTLSRGLVTAELKRVRAELRAPDTLTPLALDSLVIEMFTRAARARSRRAHHDRAPHHVGQAEEMLRANFRRSLSLMDVAAAVGVERSALAHNFRRHRRCTIGEYLRALRLEWALERLVASEQPIARIAIAAGFADQSHFTRICTRVLGMPPGEYRRASSSARRHVRSRLASSVAFTARVESP
jgi:AraC family transcriptional regulator